MRTGAPRDRRSLAALPFPAHARNRVTQRDNRPEMVFDLPGGARRLIQKVDGYQATICSGEVTWLGGEATGAMPGKLVRGARSA